MILTAAGSRPWRLHIAAAGMGVALAGPGLARDLPGTVTVAGRASLHKTALRCACPGVSGWASALNEHLSFVTGTFSHTLAGTRRLD